ncbi:MAG: hypothetical protein ACE5D3_09130, partial [Candidatus Binatia bacterium]
MKTKTFDCVEMKRRGAARVQEAIAGMEPQQESQYWRDQTERLRKRQQEIQYGKRPDHRS